MSNPHAQNLPLTSLIGTAVNNADEEFVGTAQDIFVNGAGQITGILLDTGGILGVGKNSVVVPFAMCSISVRGQSPAIILSKLHSGKVLVAPEYQTPGGTAFERATNEASTLGRAAITKAGELGDRAADKTADFGQKAVAWAAAMADKGADKVTELVHRNDDPAPTRHNGGATPGSPGPGPGPYVPTRFRVRAIPIPFRVRTIPIQFRVRAIPVRFPIRAIPSRQRRQNIRLPSSRKRFDQPREPRCSRSTSPVGSTSRR